MSHIKPSPQDTNSNHKSTSLPGIEDCVHCGLCLPACPTYERTGLESQSPRGRIAGLRLSEEGHSLSDKMQQGLNECLICRACESHCPAGINMEKLICGHRSHSKKTHGARSLIVVFLLKHFFARPKRIQFVMRVFKAIRLMLNALRSIGLFKNLEVPSAKRTRPIKKLSKPAQAIDPNVKRKKVLIWRGCASAYLLQDEQQAIARILRRHNLHVEFSEPQCCGALHAHAALAKESQELSREFDRTLQDKSFDFVVNESAGCTAWMKNFNQQEAGHSTIVEDIYELLLTVGFMAPKNKLKGSWVNFLACHQQHGELNRKAPDKILEAILEKPALQLDPYEHCCGAAGAYSLEHVQSSQDIGNKALANYEELAKQQKSKKLNGLITTNAGCLLRWEHNFQMEAQLGECKHMLLALDELYTLDEQQCI